MSQHGLHRAEVAPMSRQQKVGVDEFVLATAPTTSTAPPDFVPQDQHFSNATMSQNMANRPAGDYVHQPVLGETHDYRNYVL